MNLEDPVLVSVVILPVIILTARMVETSFKTLRLVYVAKGLKYLAAVIGMGEVAVWLLSTGLVITNLTNIFGILAYIVGYAIGTVVGIDIEERLKFGHVIVRIITRSHPEEMMQELREKGYGITKVVGQGSFGSTVSILLVLVPRHGLDELVSTLNRNYPEAIFSIEDIRSLKENAPIFFKQGQNGMLGRLREKIK